MDEGAFQDEERAFQEHIGGQVLESGLVMSWIALLNFNILLQGGRG